MLTSEYLLFSGGYVIGRWALFLFELRVRRLWLFLLPFLTLWWSTFWPWHARKERFLQPWGHSRTRLLTFMRRSRSPAARARYSWMLFGEVLREFTFISLIRTLLNHEIWCPVKRWARDLIGVSIPMTFQDIVDISLVHASQVFENLLLHLSFLFYLWLLPRKYVGFHLVRRLDARLAKVARGWFFDKLRI